MRFLQSAKTRSDLRREYNFATAPTFVFVAYIQALSPTAQAIEDLSPEGASHPNPEYPWKTGGKIITPFEHDFSDLKLSNPKMLKMLTFLESCFRLIEREIAVACFPRSSDYS